MDQRVRYLYNTRSLLVSVALTLDRKHTHTCIHYLLSCGLGLLGTWSSGSLGLWSGSRPSRERKHHFRSSKSIISEVRKGTTDTEFCGEHWCIKYTRYNQELETSPSLGFKCLWDQHCWNYLSTNQSKEWIYQAKLQKNILLCITTDRQNVILVVWVNEYVSSEMVQHFPILRASDSMQY